MFVKRQVERGKETKYNREIKKKENAKIYYMENRFLIVYCP